MASHCLGIFLAVFTLMVSSVHGFWRMPCESAGLARIDPIVSPNTTADHAHTIHGGGDFSIDTTYGSLRGANCTTCGVTEDHSSYWTPALYFEYSNGTFEVARQVGGMLAYYNLFQLPNLKAFPAGFMMIAGDTRLRNFSWPVPDPPKSSWSGDQISQLALGQKAVGFNCLDYSGPAEPTAGRHFLPNMSFLNDHCPDGLRLELYFPSCWNGKDLDSPNHKSHMAYPSVIDGGDCPDGYTVRTPTLLFETIWATADFRGQDGRFVLANGDPTGYGSHGDFISGWDVDFLQNAIDTCTNESGLIQDCPAFAGHLQDQNAPINCPIVMPPQLDNENYKGQMPALPGAVVIQDGPGYVEEGAPPASKASGVPENFGNAAAPLAVSTSSAVAPPPPPPSSSSASVPPPSSSSSSIPPPPPAVAAVAAVAQDVSSSSPPAVTSPPVPSPSQSFASTIISIMSDRVDELFIVEEVVTVTKETTAETTITIPYADYTGPPAARKRHLHQHKHAAKHHH